MKNKNLKKERGITLVALVITIVVLLILAAVAITTLTGNNNIITKAQTAKDNYDEASGNEEATLNSYNETIERYVGTSAADPIVGTYKANLTGENEGITLTVTLKNDGTGTESWSETASGTDLGSDNFTWEENNNKYIFTYQREKDNTVEASLITKTDGLYLQMGEAEDLLVKQN